MKKRWLFLVGLGLAVGAGCSSSVTEETGIQCTDGPDGGTYYCGSDELCCGGACVKETAENCVSVAWHVGRAVFVRTEHVFVSRRASSVR